MVLLAITFNSYEPDECEVVFDVDKQLCSVTLNPPGEIGEAKTEGTMQRDIQLSREPGEPLKQVGTYLVNLTRTYDKSDNIYLITGEIEVNIEGDYAEGHSLRFNCHRRCLWR